MWPGAAPALCEVCFSSVFVNVFRLQRKSTVRSKFSPSGDESWTLAPKICRVSKKTSPRWTPPITSSCVPSWSSPLCFYCVCSMFCQLLFIYEVSFQTLQSNNMNSVPGFLSVQTLINDSNNHSKILNFIYINLTFLSKAIFSWGIQVIHLKALITTSACNTKFQSQHSECEPVNRLK